MKPQRIQLSRRKGFNLDKISNGWNGREAVNCARPGPWGNPFSVLPNIKPGTRVAGGMGYVAVPTVEDAIDCFEEYIKSHPEFMKAIKVHLRGKNLACWCPPNQPCHCDVLLKIANT